MNIGRFTYDKKTDTYIGHITTLTIVRSDVRLVPNEKAGERGPDYRAVGVGDTAEYGAAWKKTSENGRDFLSLSLDDPFLPGSLNARLFTAEDGKTATLVWTPPKSKAAAKTA